MVKKVFLIAQKKRPDSLNDLWGVKKLPDMEKKVLKKFNLYSLNQDAKWNKKMGGRSLIITCGVIGTLSVRRQQDKST